MAFNLIIKKKFLEALSIFLCVLRDERADLGIS